jgi:hypothetical protein
MASQLYSTRSHSQPDCSSLLTHRLIVAALGTLGSRSPRNAFPSSRIFGPYPYTLYPNRERAKARSLARRARGMDHAWERGSNQQNLAGDLCLT